MTSQTREAIKEKLDETDRLVQEYKEHAVKFWRGHKWIRRFLFLEIISEFGLLLAYGHNCDSCGDSGSGWVYELEIGILFMLGVTFLWDFFSNYTRKAEIFDIGNMECRLVKVDLNALLDEIENLRDDEVLRKRVELERRVNEVTKWVQDKTAYISKFNLQAKPSPPPPSASPKNDKK